MTYPLVCNYARGSHIRYRQSGTLLDDPEMKDVGKGLSRSRSRRTPNRAAMHYENPGKIPETHLPCGHAVTWCEECDRGQRHYNDYLDWCAQWERPGIVFAINSGHVIHARDCTAVYGPDRVTPDDPWNGLNGSKPLTQVEAMEWLKHSHERRRCMLCGPDVPMPRWVKVGRRWQLADKTQVL